MLEYIGAVRARSLVCPVCIPLGVSVCVCACVCVCVCVCVSMCWHMVCTDDSVASA